MLCRHAGWCVDAAAIQILGSAAFLLGMGIYLAIENVKLRLRR